MPEGMQASATRGAPRGRVLVLGGNEAAQRATEQLVANGYACAVADSPDRLLQVAGKLRPEAILLASAGSLEYESMALLRQHERLRDLPVLGDLTKVRAADLRKLGVDDWIHSADELFLRLDSAVRERRLLAKDERARLRMEKLLEIAQAATSSLELDQILRIAVEKVSQVVSADRCSVVLVEGTSPRIARVVASREKPTAAPFPLDLARYPELRRVLETGQGVYIENAEHEPLMEEVRRFIAPIGVRSILVQPLVCQEDLLGALFLRMTKQDVGFAREDQEFARAVSAALSNSIRNATLHAALRRKREDLESAYVDRYRELSDANRRLKELNRLKDEIIAVVSHDLRAPLQVLLGHGRLMLETKLDDSQRPSAEAVVRQGRKILDLVENLLERGRGEKARVAIEPRLVDVAEMCKETGAELAILAKQRGVAIKAETPESLMVVGDEVKLRQVLQNLITNAIQHAREGGRVMIRAQRLRRPDGEAARLVVQDDGKGLPADQLALVFDRYHHGPGGVGLGLAICKEFVELHGGEVWAENAPEGGCAFQVTLPLAQAPRLIAAPQLPESENIELPRILVVEDEPEVAAVVTEILRSRYRVEVARDGTEGVAKARALHPDLVVMDVFLPRLDGLDAAVSLKSSSDTSNIPVILLSAHQGVAEKVRALNLGAVDYLSKPFQALELLNRVERALKLQQTEAKLQSAALLRRGGADPATGLFDREGLLARLEQEAARSRRYGRALSLALLRPTAPLGDQLRQCASLVRQKLRAPDLLGHLEGGVFVAVLPEADEQSALAMCERIGREIEQELGRAFVVTAREIRPEHKKLEDVLSALER